MAHNESEKSNQFITLSFWDKFWLICGHIHMDLCNAVIFTHLLLYLSQNVGVSAIHAGIIFFVAQNCDALFIFLLKNEFGSILSTSNGRRICHIGGTLLMLVLIPLIFHPMLFEIKTFPLGTNWGVFIYYLVMLMIGSLGYSAVYMSTMAEITQLNIDNKERRLLYHLRFGAKSVTTMMVCLLFYCIMYKMQNNRQKTLRESNNQTYEMVAYILTGLGALCTILFQLKNNTNKSSTPTPKTLMAVDGFEQDEPERNDIMLFEASDLSGVIYGATSNNEESIELVNLKRQDWLKIIEYYPVTFCYMFGKLMVNVTQVYCILYLVNFIDLDQKISNLLAFVIQFGGVLATPLMHYISSFFGRKGSMAVGLIFASIVSACYGIFNIDAMSEISIIVQQFILSMLLGIASTFLTLSAHDLTIDISKEDDTACLTKLKAYYKYIMFGFPAGCSIIIFALLCAIIKKDYSSAALSESEMPTPIASDDSNSDRQPTSLNFY